MKKATHRAHFVFLNQSTSWWSWLAPRGFKHVLFFIEDGHGGAWHCNPYMPFCINRGSDITSYDDLLQRVSKLRSAYRVVSVEVREWMTRRYCPVGLWMCHTLAKCLSGVDVGFVFHAYHLYRKLLKRNGTRNFRVVSDVVIHANNGSLKHGT